MGRGAHGKQNPDLYDRYTHHTLEGQREGLLGVACSVTLIEAIFGADVCSLGSNGDIAEILMH